MAILQAVRVLASALTATSAVYVPGQTTSGFTDFKRYLLTRPGASATCFSSIFDNPASSLDHSAPVALRKPNSETEISSFWSFAVVFSISTNAEPSRMSCQVKFLEGEDVGARSVAADWAGGVGLGGSAGAA